MQSLTQFWKKLKLWSNAEICGESQDKKNWLTLLSKKQGLRLNHHKFSSQLSNQPSKKLLKSKLNKKKWSILEDNLNSIKNRYSRLNAENWTPYSVFI